MVQFYVLNTLVQIKELLQVKITSHLSAILVYKYRFFNLFFSEYLLVHYLGSTDGFLRLWENDDGKDDRL